MKCVHLGTHRSQLLVHCDSRHYRHANDLLALTIHTAQAQPLSKIIAPRLSCRQSSAHQNKDF